MRSRRITVLAHLPMASCNSFPGSPLAPMAGMPETVLESGTGRALIVVSNREPYQHVRRANGSITVAPTTGGVSVALDALMRERGGTWIAHGGGDADADVVDANDRVAVPPDEPSYMLRRV